MSVVLYKKGGQRDIDGFKCDVLLVAPEYFFGEPPEGWFLSPEAAYDMQEERHEEENTEEAEEKVLTNAEVRQAAKDAGHDKWETARIETLKDFLK